MDNKNVRLKRYFCVDLGFNSNFRVHCRLNYELFLNKSGITDALNKIKPGELDVRPQQCIISWNKLLRISGAFLETLNELVSAFAVDFAFQLKVKKFLSNFAVLQHLQSHSVLTLGGAKC